MTIYTETGTYTDVLTAQNSCDSTVYLDLTVLETYTTNLVEEICEGETYTVGTSTYTTNGIYTDVLTAENGCDSTIYLNLTVLNVPTTFLNEVICNEDSYTVGTSTYTQTGEYTDILTAVNGCDSIVHLNLTVLDNDVTTINQTICEGETYTVGNSVYTTSGTYVDTLTAGNGCSNIVTLNLTVLPTVYTILDNTICDGESIEVGMTTYTEEGTYTEVLTAENGCDSLVTLNLTVLPTYSVSITETICDNESYTVGTSTYTQTGMYTDILTAENGCDSTVNLDLIVLETYVSSLTATICDDEFYQVGNEIYTQTGVYETLLTAQNGCDSTVILDLTTLPTYEVHLTETICDDEFYVVGTSFYNQSGNYTNVLTAQTGCDSIVNLTLDVLPNYEVFLEETICEGDSYTFGFNDYSQTGVYTVTFGANNGCDSTVTLNLVVLPTYETSVAATICDDEFYQIGNELYTQTGIYETLLTAQNGCDSTVILDLIALPTYEVNLEETICEDEFYIVGNSFYDQAGNYTDVLSTQNGCDSIVNLTLNISPNYEVFLEETICEGESYMIGFIEYTQTGNYSVTFGANNGCDSTILLNLVVLPASETNITATICDNEFYQISNQVYTETGFYETLLTAQNGCDSIVLLDLIVLPTYEVTIQETICEGESYSIGNEIYETTGNHAVLFSSALGCDSLVNLDLTVLSNSEVTLNEVICEGDSYTIASNEYSATGVYELTLAAENGCDSLITLNLSVLDNSYNVLEETICEGESYTIGNTDYTATGIYLDTLTSSNGCNSIIELQLIVLQPSSYEFSQEICEGENVTIGTTTYSETGVYTNLLTAQNGCDSLVTLDLIVHPNNQLGISAVICAGEIYTVGTNEYTTTGFYQNMLNTQEGCDSLVNLSLTVLPSYAISLEETICEGESINIGTNTYAQTGIYTNLLTAQNGCDSLVTLDLTVLTSSAAALETTICEGEAYVFNNTAYTEENSYEIIVLNAVGCDSLVTLNLTVEQAINTEFEAQICAETSYEWNNEVYTETGSYTQNFNTINGCDSLVTLNLTVENILSENLIAAICDGESYEMGGVNYTTTGYYETNLSSTSGCDSLVTLDLTVHTNPSVEITGPSAFCEGQIAELSIAENEGILWSTGETTNTISVEEAGTYSVTVTNNLDCSTTTNYELVATAISAPELIGYAEPTGCGNEDGYIELGATENVLFSIDGGENWQSIGLFSNLGNGVYDLMTSSLDGICTTAYADQIEFNAPAGLLFTDVLTENPTNCDYDNGTINISITGGTNDYLYSIDNGENWSSNNVFSNLSAGNYIVVVSNADGTCTTSYDQAIEFNTPEILTISEGAIVHPICYDQASGQLHVNTIGGMGNLSYEWSNGATTATNANLVAGIYEVTVSDENNCNQTLTFTLENPAPFTIALSSEGDTLLCAEETALLSIDNTDINEYEWSQDDELISTDGTLAVTAAGLYTLSATNEDGCIASDEIEVNFSEESIEARFILPIEGLINQPIVTADVSWPIPDSIQWFYDDGINFIRLEENQLIFDATAAGTYTIQMKAFRGDCSVTLTKSITIFVDESELANPDNYQPGYTQILEFNVWPNPNNGQFGLRVSLSGESNLIVYIFNELGEIIDQRNLEGTNFYEEPFDLNLPTGIYTLILQTDTEWRYFNFVAD